MSDVSLLERIDRLMTRVAELTKDRDEYRVANQKLAEFCSAHTNAVNRDRDWLHTDLDKRVAGLEEALRLSYLRHS